MQYSDFLSSLDHVATNCALAHVQHTYTDQFLLPGWVPEGRLAWEACAATYPGSRILEYAEISSAVNSASKLAISKIEDLFTKLAGDKFFTNLVSSLPTSSVERSE